MHTPRITLVSGASRLGLIYNDEELKKRRHSNELY